MQLPGSRSTFAEKAAWVVVLAGACVAPLVLDPGPLRGAGAGSFFVMGSSLYRSLWVQVVASVALALFSAAIVAGRRRVRWHWTLWVAVAFLGWAGVATAVSPSWRSALLGSDGQALGLLTIAALVTLAMLSAQLVDGAQRLRAFAIALVVPAVLEALYGIVQFLHADPIAWHAATWGNRAFGTMGNPDMLGALLVPALALGVGLGLAEDSRAWRAVWTVTTAVMSVGLLVTFTRAAWLGAVVAVVALIALAWPVIRAHRSRLLIVLAAAVLCVVAAGIVAEKTGSATSSVSGRVASAVSSGNRDVSARVELARVSALAIVRRPITGFGPDMFADAYYSGPTKRLESLSGPYSFAGNSHDIVLDAAVGMGVPGALLLLALLGGAVFSAGGRLMRDRAMQDPERALGASVVAGLVGYFVAVLFTPQLPAGAAVCFLLVGACVAIAIAPSTDTVEPPEVAPSRGSRVVAGVIAFVCVVWVAGVLVLVLADHRAARAADAGVAPLDRVQAAESAMTLDPFSVRYRVLAAEAYAALALEQASQGDGEPTRIAENAQHAIALAKAAQAMSPGDPTRLTFVADMYLDAASVAQDKSSYTASAVQYAKRAVDAAPDVLPSRYALGYALNSAGEQTKASHELEYALAIYPGYSEAALLLASIDVARGDKTAARRVLRTALEASPSGALAPQLQSALDAAR